MNEFFTILTTVGAAKLANATALGTTVEISEMAVGDGGGKAVTPDQSQTSLVHTLRRKPLNSIRIDPDNPNWIVCEQVLPPDIGGWTIREVGLFDSAGDLIAVGNFPETYKPLLSEGSGRTQTIRIILEVSSASSVELKVDPSVVLATREYVNQQDASILQQAKDYASQQDTHLKAYVDTQDKSYQTVAKADASKKANQALSDAKGYADSQDAKMLASAKADASSKANAAESAAKNYAQSQDTSLKSYVDTQDKSYQTAASADASKKANQALADAKSYAEDAGNLKRGTVTSERLPANLVKTDNKSVITGINYLDFAPTSSWGVTLRIGGNGDNSPGVDKVASIKTTDGDIHLDPGPSKSIYLGYYRGNGSIRFGNGSSGFSAYMLPDGNLYLGNNINNHSLPYWHAQNLPVPSLSQSIDINSNTPYAWTPQRIADVAGRLNSAVQNTTMHIGNLIFKMAVGSKVTSAPDKVQTVNFDTPFPNACLSVMVTSLAGARASINNNSDGMFQEVEGTRTTSSVDVVCQNTATTSSMSDGLTPTLLAIGY